jgi:hypothetical protein
MIKFEDCNYTVQQTMQILAVRKTKFFSDVLPELESYLEGSRRIITGRSILAYRENKLAHSTNEPELRRRRRRSRNALDMIG